MRARIRSNCKRRLFFKKYGLSAFTGKKIKSISFLVNFFEKFKIAHKIHFSSWFFKNLKIWQNTIFSACFLYIIVRKKRASEKVRFYCRRLKIYFQKATNVINAFPTSITSYEASFSKRRLFHLKIAWFSWKVSEFWWFFENQKAPFFNMPLHSLVHEKSSPKHIWWLRYVFLTS